MRQALRKTLSAALLAATLGLGGASTALADDPTAAPAPAGQPSVDWTVQDLLANPAAKAVLDRQLPGIEDDPRLPLVLTWTLRAVADNPDAHIDPAKLNAIQADLSALPKS
jgi:hypothetical protein